MARDIADVRKEQFTSALTETDEALILPENTYRSQEKAIDAMTISEIRGVVHRMKREQTRLDLLEQKMDYLKIKIRERTMDDEDSL